jgi:UDP-N-acetylglucosamine enolpyruvyl transferase
MTGPVDPDTLTVRGGRRLHGAVTVPGFKHSLVSSVAVAAATDAPLRLDNCPDNEEARVLVRLLGQLGGRAELADGVLTVDGTGISSTTMSADDVSRIHGSVYLLPVLLGRFGSVRMPESGGCRIGDGASGRRPMGHYVEVFERFGAVAAESAVDGSLTVTTRRLVGCEIDMADFMSDRRLRSGPLYSGATKTALLTAAMAQGTSVIHSPYPKPDVTELVAVLRALGVDVEHTASGSYVVHGCAGPLPGPGASHVLIPDLIAVVTWICAGSLLAGEPLTVSAPRMRDAAVSLAPERRVLDALGVRIDWTDESCIVHPARELSPVDVVAASHGVFSDCQPLLALVASRARGHSTIVDTVWTGRFTYAAGFAALGIDVDVHEPRLDIRGPWCGGAGDHELHAHDLRAAAALLLAALVVPGTTTLSGMSHLARGYPDLPADLVRLGASILERPSILERRCP